MKASVIFFATGLLLACGSSATKINGPDGEPGWFAITCRRSRANCLEKAGEVCPHGYRTSSAVDHDGMYAQVSQSGGTAYTTYNGEMMIKCE